MMNDGGDCLAFIIHHSAFIISQQPPMPPDAAHWLIVLFSAAFGGCVGSFLNVVVYRLPIGLSLISPPSHCPSCKTPIRWFDNVPVFGWIMLGGRCRHCRCRIPIRYPLVEAFTAAMFAALAAVENPLEAAAACPYHLVLLCTLLCSALIEVDGNRPPLRLFVPALIVGIAAPLVWPIAQPAAWPGLLSAAEARWSDVLTGLAAGIVVSGALWLLALARQTMRAQTVANVAPPSTGLLLGLISTGAFLGWSSLCVLALATLAVHAMLLCPRRGEPRVYAPPSVWLLISTIAWLLV
jgi:leader peptidase (prepilin peptidase) / N-methyltransferase